MFHLYTRNNHWYKQWNILKVGIFGEDLKDGRNQTYKTSEPREGYFESIWEIDEDEKEAFDSFLKDELECKRYIDPIKTGGTEFYKNEDDKLEDFIEEILKTVNIKYKKLNEDEIDNISRKKYDTKNKSNKLQDKINEFKFRRTKFNHLDIINLYPFQKDVDIVDFLIKNKKGILNWICRLGKTIKSIDTLIKLGCKKICIGVPSTQLLKQWENKLKKHCSHKIILLGDNNSPNIIKEYNENEELIILTTYSSSHKIKEVGVSFDLKILDEVHHLTYTDDTDDKSSKPFKDILDIESKYQLSLTATIKTGKVNIVGNDDESVFGKIIDYKSLKWAIENGWVCDYEICTPIIDKDAYIEKYEELEETLTFDIELVISCIQQLEVLKLNNHSHIINYTNKIENSKICKEIIDKLLTLEEYKVLAISFVNEYLSDTTTKKQEEILDNYKKSCKGIIHSCYKLGEGFDEEVVDMVCISENMVSNIRILQSLLRPHTKSKINPEKKALILLPIIIDDEYKPYEEDEKFKKVIDIIDILSTTDVNVVQKSNFIKISKKTKLTPKRNYYNIDEIFSTSVKTKFIHKTLMKGSGFLNIKKLIKLLNFRENDSLSLREDYINDKLAKDTTLPKIEVIESILNKSKKTWFELYDIDISNYYTYTDFQSKYGSLYNSNKYIDLSIIDIQAPSYSDLEELYRTYGYNINFWNDPIGCNEEF